MQQQRDKTDRERITKERQQILSLSLCGANIRSALKPQERSLGSFFFVFRVYRKIIP